MGPNIQIAGKSYTADQLKKEPSIVKNAITEAKATGEKVQNYYQQYMAVPTPKQNEPLTLRKALTDIYSLSKTNPEESKSMFEKLLAMQADPSSGLYLPYLKPTNKAIENLRALGIDTSNIDDKWFDDNAWLMNYYETSTTTNNVKAPTKKSSLEARAAYEYNQLLDAREITKKAKEEFNAAMEEVAILAQMNDRAWTDDDIVDMVYGNKDKYPTLAKMEAAKATGEPLELNAAVPYSKDALYASVWASRNPDYKGNLEGAMINSYLGRGVVAEQNDALAAALNRGNSETYDAYSVGSTMDEERLYFRRLSFDQDWIDANSERIINGNDETKKKMLGNVIEGEATTVQLENELQLLYKKVNDKLVYSTDADAILSDLQSDPELKELLALDKTLNDPLNNKLVKTTRAIPYRWRDFEQQVREACETNKANSSQTTFVNGLVQDIVSDGKADTPLTQAAPQSKAPEQETKDEAPGTEAAGKPEAAPEQVAQQPEQPEQPKAPEKTTEQKMEEEATERLNASAPAVENNGTEEEKLVFGTAKNPSFNIMTNALSSIVMKVDKMTGGKVQAAVNQSVAPGYMAQLTVTKEYEATQAELAETQEKLDNAQKNYERLASRLEATGNATTFDVNFINWVTEQPDWEEIKSNIQSDDPGKKAAGYQQFNAKIFDGGFADETYQRDIFYLMSVDDNNELQGVPEKVRRLADVAINGFENTSGKEQLTPAEEDEMRGWQKDIETYTAEIEELERKLKDGEENYQNALATKKMLTEEYETFSTLMGGNMDMSLLSDIEFVYDMGLEFTPSQWTAYSVYDMAVQDGNPKEDVYNYAWNQLGNGVLAKQKLDAAYKHAVDSGVALNGKQIRNIEQKQGLLDRENYAAATFLLDDQPDFENIAREAMKTGATDDMSEMTKLNIMAMTTDDPNKIAASLIGVSVDNEFLKQFSLDGNQDGLETAFTIADYLSRMTEDEKLRYFYLLSTEGEDAANRYFAFLNDETYGVFITRRSEERSKEIHDYVTRGGWEAAGGYALSFLTNLFGNVQSLFTTVEAKITGKEVNPKGAGYSGVMTTEALRTGFKDYLTDKYGESEFRDFVIDAATSGLDSALSNIVFGSAMNAVGQSLPILGRLYDLLETAGNGKYGAIFKWGADVLGDFEHALPMGFGAAANAYRETVIRGGDPDQCDAMFWTTLLAESLSETLTAGNMRKAANEGMAGEILGFFRELFVGGGKEAFEEGVNQWWEDTLDQVIMGELSNYDQYLSYYTDEMGLPLSIAEKYAGKDMFTNICKAAAAGFVSSVGSSSVSYVRGEVIGAGERAVTQRRAAIDAFVLSKAGQNPNTSNVNLALSSVFSSGIDRNEAIAASSHFLQDVCEGRTKVAVNTVQQIEAYAEDDAQAQQAKVALTFAALTEGNGNRELQDIVAKVRSGERLTHEDVQHLIDAVDSDMQDSSMLEAYKAKVEQNRLAAKTRDVLATPEYAERMAATNKPVEEAEAKVTKKEAELEDAQNDLAAATQNASDAITELENNPDNDSALAPVQQNAQHVAGMKEEVDNKTAEVAEAQEEVRKAKEERDKQQAEIMDDARAQAEQEKADEDARIAQEEEQRKIDAEIIQKTRAIARDRANFTRLNAEDIVRELFPNVKGEDYDHALGMVMAIQQSMSTDVDSMIAQKGFTDALARKFGLKTEFVNVTGQNGELYFNARVDPETGVLTINENATQGDIIYAILIHEITHLAEGSKTYYEMADFLLQNKYGKGVTYQGILAQMKAGDVSSQAAQDVLAKMNLYNSATKKSYTNEQMLQEIVADEVGYFISADQEAIDRLVSEKPNLARRILATIKNFLRKAVGLENDTLTQAQRVVDMLEASLGEEKVKQGEQPQATGQALVTDAQGETLASELPGGTVAVDPDRYSLSSFNGKERDRVRQALYNAKNEDGTPRFTKQEVDKYIYDAMGIAAKIAQDRGRLDFEANEAQRFLKPNNDYHFTLDASTLCAKRLLYQGTFDYVQHALPDEVFTPLDLIDLVNIMSNMGYETPCGICYVESRRRWLDTYAKKFLDEISTDPDGFIEKRFKKATAEEKAALRESLTGEKPSIDDLTTSDGLEALRNNNPYMHKAFVAAMNAKGSANPKVVQLRTEYRGDIGELSEKDIQNVKDIGGLRIQSFSDFETPHLLDMVQAVLDMSAVGLTSQAYTKVPNFAWVFGDTGIKINLSLIGKGTGLDADGNLVFDNVEGINFDEAMRLRNRYSKNVGTILVGINDEHIIAAMGDDRIDFIIPFHRSGWSDLELKGIPSLQNYLDYTDSQNERIIVGPRENKVKLLKDKGQKAVDNWIANEGANHPGYEIIPQGDGKFTISYRNGYETESFDTHNKRTGEKLGNFEPVGAHKYWDFSKSGEENARVYLQMCAEAGRIPKFSQFLVDNGDGTFSLPEGDDKRSTAIRTGYWKTLIDFKMYDNDGNGAEQTAVTPNINMAEAYRVLKEHKLGRQMPDRNGIRGKFIPVESNNAVPIARDAAEEYIEQIKRKREGIKPTGPNDTLEATPETTEINVADLGPSQFRNVQENPSLPPIMPQNNIGATEEGYNAQQAAMAIDPETGETVRERLSLPSVMNIDQLLESLSADEFAELSSMDEETEEEEADPREVLTVAIEDIESEFDPTIYNGRLYVKPETMDYWLSGKGFGSSNPNYAQCYITTMNPADFLRMTTVTPRGQARILDEAGFLDKGIDQYGSQRSLEWQSKWQPIMLNINEADGVIEGHEGRHRCIALARAGVTEVPVLLYENKTKYEKTRKDEMTLEGQGTSDYRNGNSITFDNVIPLNNANREEIEQRFLASPEDEANAEANGQRVLRYSIPNSLSSVKPVDAAYLSAVDHGDMETAQRMVDEKAREAGYDVEYLVWRGDSQPYNELEPGENGGNLGHGLYFTPNRNYAERFASGVSPVRKFYLKAGNTFDYDAFTQEFNDYVTSWFEENGLDPNGYVDEQTWSDIWDDFISENDYDSVKATNVGGLSYGASEIAVQNSWQAKLADPVTYDDNGNVIPLSERFNTGENDIRYSLPSQNIMDQMIRYRLANGQNNNGPTEENTEERTGSVAGMINSSVDYSAGNGYIRFSNAPSDTIRQNLEKLGMFYSSSTGQWQASKSRNIPVDVILDAVDKGNQGILITRPARTTTRKPAAPKPTAAEMRQQETEAGLALPLEGYNPTMSTAQGPAQRAFGQGMLQSSDEIDRQARAYVLAQNGRTIDTNAEQIDRAIRWVRHNRSAQGSDGLYESLLKVTNDEFDYRSADGQARMVTMMGMAVAKGDTMMQVALADAFNRQGTDLGRALQARKLFRLMTPAGRIASLDGIKNKIQQSLDAKGTVKTLTFSHWVYSMAAAATEEGDFEKVRKVAAQELAAQLPASWKEKLQAWRMLSMLGNTRTHVRNFLGNTAFMPMKGTKNIIGAALEAGAEKAGIIKEGERTKTLRRSDSEARAFAAKDAEAIKNTLTGEGKYTDGDLVQRERKMFGQGKGLLSRTLGRATQWAIEKNSNALEAEDWFFLERHYRGALAGYMTANNLTTNDMNGTTLEKARAYAIEEAQKATYRDACKVAEALNTISRKGGALGFLLDAALPFKKTPVNILRRGIEYSPIGLIKSFSSDLYHLKQYYDYQNGKLNALPEKAISPVQYIDRLSSGLSGTAFTALGAVLNAAGIVSVGIVKDDDELDKLRGKQQYSLNFSLFGYDINYTIDWAAPTVLPLFVGATINEVREALSEDGDGLSVEDVVDAILGISEPLWNLSMLEGVNSLFDVSQYGEGNAITQVAEKILTNYGSSFIPSALGAATRSFFDTTRRKSYVESGASFATPRYAWESIENKIPFLSQTNIPYRNVWGEPEESNWVLATFENFISPGYVNAVKNDPVVDELERLYQNTRDPNMIPKAASKTIAVGGKTIRLSAEQYDQYVVDRGQTARQCLEDLMASEAWEISDDGTRAMMVNDAWTYANQVARSNLDRNASKDSWVRSAEQNGNFVDMAVQRAADTNRNDYIDGYGQILSEALDNKDREMYELSLAALGSAGASDAEKRAPVRDYFKPRYIQAAEDGDKRAMEEIKDKLLASGLGFKADDIDAWGTFKSVKETDETWLDMTEEKQRLLVGEIGRYGKGNIDLWNRPLVETDDGQIATVNTITVGFDDGVYVLPTVIDGRIVSEDEAIDHFLETDEHLGRFDSEKDANDYAWKLHLAQESYYNLK